MGDVPRLRNLSVGVRLSAMLIAAALLLSGCIFGGESDRDLSQYFPPPPEEGAQETQQSAATTGAAARELAV